MLKKALIAALLVMLALTSLQQPAHAQSKTLRFATINPESIQPVNQMLVDHFQKTHPDYKVEVEYIPGDKLVETFTTQAAAKTLPDVVFLADLYVVPFAKAGIVYDMQSLAEADKDFDLKDVYENMLGLSKVNGKGLYMVPSSYDIVTVYYNKTMFDKAGAPTPKPDWTWDDMVKSCVTIREKTKEYCLGIGGAPGTGQGEDWWAYYVPWMRGYGGDVMDKDGKKATLNSPETIAGIQAYVDLWTKYDIALPLDFDAGGNCFLNQKCAVFLMIPGFMSAVRGLQPQPFEWDVEVIPSHPKGRFTGMGTYGYAVSANATDPQAAWDFVKYLASKDAQLAIATNYAGTPLLRSLREDPKLVNLAPPPKNITAFIKNGANGILPTYFPGDCGSLYAGQINQEIKDAIDGAIKAGTKVADALNAANDNIQKCLDRTMK